MVSTRSMSGTTKKPDAKKIVKSGTTKKVADKGCTTAVWSVIDDAYCFFMKDCKAKYYEKNAKYYEKHPRGRIIPEELRDVIMQKWRDMSDGDKAPYVECAEELRAQGLNYLTAVNDEQEVYYKAKFKTTKNIAKSGTAKKVADKGCIATIWSVIDDAYCFFMKDSEAKYYEKHSRRRIMVMFVLTGLLIFLGNISDDPDDETLKLMEIARLEVDGGGVKNGMEGIVVGILIVGKEGIVVGMVGSDAGKGGNVTLGIVVGIDGRDGIVGREVAGIGGSAAALGRLGIAGIGGNANLGRVGMVGSVGIVGIVGSVGIVGTVGCEDCSKWRAAKLTSMLEIDSAKTKTMKTLWFIGAIVDLMSRCNDQTLFKLITSNDAF
ncbi:hypothetical protein DCAR_0831448 [Daucus carota subsp. sativus]|uniref:HMG box domain-containing protein n=1 Tax=Daucus carota subsp. sativus TaxID=79200 RepID=A0A175YLX9_DAUCS|nr:hypothetical protein DCAR_0831448 [Daucus carota subsp. sativus]